MTHAGSSYSCPACTLGDGGTDHDAATGRVGYVGDDGVKALLETVIAQFE